MVAREMFVAGECFVRMRPRRAEDGLLVPLQMQLLQSEMLPFEKTGTAANGNRIRCGIEFDLIGRRVAYHFRRSHPGDSTDQRVAVPETVRVPAEDVLHIYRPIDAGQIRGLPHIAPAMVRLFLLDQYDDAELDRKKTAAMFAGFITKTAPEEPMMGTEEPDPEGAAIASLEPGTLQVLLPGEDVKFSSPADVGSSYEAFQYRTLLGVSASLGLPYHLVTGDVRQANYSSLRAELVEFRRRVQQLQHGVIAHQLCRPVWARWLETAQLAGRLDVPDPAAARMVQWIPPRWDWVDPLKDIQAQVLAMEAGITSRRKVVEATGYDVEEVGRAAQAVPVPDRERRGFPWRARCRPGSGPRRMRLGLLRRSGRPQGGARDLSEHRRRGRPARARGRGGQLRRHHLPPVSRRAGLRRAHRQGVFLPRRRRGALRDLLRPRRHLRDGQHGRPAALRAHDPGSRPRRMDAPRDREQPAADLHPSASAALGAADVMDAVAMALDALFADGNIASEAVYTPEGGAPILVHVVARRADETTGFGDARIWSETTRVDLRVAEVPNPRPGDRIEIAGEAFLIQGEPVRDRERLVWTVDLRPA